VDGTKEFGVESIDPSRSQPATGVTDPSVKLMSGMWESLAKHSAALPSLNACRS
jgi:hypothetical protein